MCQDTFFVLNKHKRRKFIMTIYDELVARGLIAQVTDEEEIKDLINNGKATFYIGFDPTADSLHVGHFMALCLMKRLQMAGNKPIALIGGGTAMVGDPSGRSDMRQMMTQETIQHNCDCFKKQMERFIDFSDGKALIDVYKRQITRREQCSCTFLCFLCFFLTMYQGSQFVSQDLFCLV